MKGGATKGSYFHPIVLGSKFYEPPLIHTCMMDDDDGLWYGITVQLIQTILLSTYYGAINTLCR
jgi:hypothetical protein